MNRQSGDEMEIDLRELFFALLDKLHILILSFILGAICLYFVSIAFISPKYQSSTSIYVLNKQDNSVVTYSDLQSGTQLTKDYAELVKSRSVTEKVINQLKLNTVYEDMKYLDSGALASMISVDNTTDTRIIRITVTDTNPARAQDIANAIREAASLHIETVMDIEAVNVVDYAEMPMESVSPNVLMNTAMGAAAGTLIAAFIVILIHLTDDRIKGPDDVEKYLGVSVLGTIPLDNNLSKTDVKKSKR
ncbi:MAG: protein-tyrosine kinase [Lachnospiraceae bacterium]|nr:protein-tyrosine kinase [Lachnospiraceae bacterium]